MTVDRRHLLKGFALSPLSMVLPMAAGASIAPGQGHFLHGVASGDPGLHNVVLWTRVTPDDQKTANVDVAWQVATDPDCRHVVKKGKATTSPARDFCVKVDVSGLQPGHDYWYSFHSADNQSTIGRTRTLPEGHLSELNLAFVTCSLYPAGYFNAYDHIAKLEKLDAVIELGDYTYEYGAGEDDYGMAIGRALNRIPEPAHDTVTLADYRMRQAQYKRDPDLQAVHARVPWICVWDDHETANDSWVGGAENHHPEIEGAWLPREAAALQAYYEWMPIREPVPGQAWEAINRVFQFGDLATLYMVETRLMARSYQLEYDRSGDVPLAVYDKAPPDHRKRITDPAIVKTVLTGTRHLGDQVGDYVIGPDPEALAAIIDNPLRQMLGKRQEEWLTAEIARSVTAKIPWQIIGNEVVIARTKAPDILKAVGQAKIDALLAKAPAALREEARKTIELFSYPVPFDLDGWDGYPAARSRLFDTITASTGNTIIVSGDSHAFWVNELETDDKSIKVAVEFGTSSITSPSPGDYLPGIDLASIFVTNNDEVKFCDQSAKGFVLLTITPQEVIGQLIAVETLKKPYQAHELARYRVNPSSGRGIGKIDRL